ncbi:MAG: recombination protein RecR [SAR324 cluster bacterium]|nr:recombination protein RecR [SAR324 cluster bacterium]
MQIPESLERLIEEFSKFPGVGRKTAQRLAFSMLHYTSKEAEQLAEAIVDVKHRIRHCSLCFSFTESDPCPICEDPSRNRSIICVVEQPNNIFPIEKSGVFRGLYHVLMGAISPLEGIGPDQLKFSELLRRLEKDETKELILATHPTVKGEATSLFLQQALAEKGLKITRLARGIPAGGDLEYVDDVTLIEAFSGRQLFGKLE